MAPTRYGLTPKQWETADAEIRGILVMVASDRAFIAYSDLANRVQSVSLEPHSAALADLLGQVSTDEDRAGRGMLSVVVTHKDGDMQPGPGFFALARELGRNTSDILRCWVEEFKNVHEYWSSHKNAPSSPAPRAARAKGKAN